MRKTVVPLLLLVAACGGGSKVSRVDAGETVDLSGRWNDTDSRLVSEEMISDLLASPRFLEIADQLDRRPVIIVGTISNRSLEHIDVATFTQDIERAITNSGRATFVASRRERNELRRERVDQVTNASDETRKDFGRERGADLMLKGEINSVVDSDSNNTLVFYQVNLFLVNVETNEKVWMGSKKIKKVIRQ